MPTLRGPCVLIDVGANVTPKPRHLFQYGVMGAIFRCAACDTAVMRLARTPRGVWLDLRGARSVVVPDGR